MEKERPTIIDASYEATTRAKAIEKHREEILRSLTPHIKMVAEEAHAVDLIDFDILAMCATSKRPLKDKAHVFFSAVVDRIYKGNSKDYDSFLKVLNSSRLNLYFTAEKIKRAVKEYKSEAKVPASSEPDSGAISSISSSDTEQRHNFYDEPFSAPASHHWHSSSQDIPFHGSEPDSIPGNIHSESQDSEVVVESDDEETPPSMSYISMSETVEVQLMKQQIARLSEQNEELKRQLSVEKKKNEELLEENRRLKER